jgi:hypothetical protein
MPEFFARSLACRTEQLHLSGNAGDLNRSMQHLLRVHLQRAEQAKVVREC